MCRNASHRFSLFCVLMWSRCGRGDDRIQPRLCLVGDAPGLWRGSRHRGRRLAARRCADPERVGGAGVTGTELVICAMRTGMTFVGRWNGRVPACHPPNRVASGPISTGSHSISLASTSLRFTSERYVFGTG